MFSCTVAVKYIFFYNCLLILGAVFKQTYSWSIISNLCVVPHIIIQPQFKSNTVPGLIHWKYLFYIKSKFLVTKRPIKVYLRMTRFTDTDNGGIVRVWRMLVQCGSLSLCTQNLRKFPLSFQECWRGLSGPRGTLQGSADGWRLKKIYKIKVLYIYCP